MLHFNSVLKQVLNPKASVIMFPQLRKVFPIISKKTENLISRVGVTLLLHATYF